MTFLEQLQQSAGLLSNNIASSSTYNPTTSDFRDGVAQNRFVGNQFQMPSTSMTVPAINTGTSPNFGSFTYTPLPFNALNLQGLSPLLQNVVSQVRGGRGGDGGGVSAGPNAVESIGGVAYGINPVTGVVNTLDPQSLTAQIANNIANLQSLTPAGLISTSLGLNDYGSQLSRIANQFGEDVANEVAQQVKENYRMSLFGVSPQATNMAPPPGTRVSLTTESGARVPGFINSFGGFQRGTPIGDINTGDDNGDNDGDDSSNQPDNQPDRGGNGAGEGAAGGCFVKGTMIEMADGTTKEITTIKVGEETKGGTVQAKMEFMPQNIYNYKDVLVSGSHWVIEDNQFIAVEDSKHGVLTDRIEPVYTFKTSNNRIWINNIEFGDFETGSDDDWEPHFEAVRQKLNKELRNV